MALYKALAYFSSKSKYSYYLSSRILKSTSSGISSGGNRRRANPIKSNY